MDEADAWPAEAWSVVIDGLTREDAAQLDECMDGWPREHREWGSDPRDRHVSFSDVTRVAAEVQLWEAVRRRDVAPSTWYATGRWVRRQHAWLARRAAGRPAEGVGGVVWRRRRTLRWCTTPTGRRGSRDKKGCRRSVRRYWSSSPESGGTPPLRSTPPSGCHARRSVMTSSSVVEWRVWRCVVEASAQRRGRSPVGFGGRTARGCGAHGGSLCARGFSRGFLG